MARIHSGSQKMLKMTKSAFLHFGAGEGGGHTCTECGSRFGLPSDLTEHRRQSTCGGSRWKCAECGKSLGSRRGLEEHRRIHTRSQK